MEDILTKLLEQGILLSFSEIEKLAYALRIGEYSEEYKNECMNIIRSIKKTKMEDGHQNLKFIQGTKTPVRNKNNIESNIQINSFESFTNRLFVERKKLSSIDFLKKCINNNLFNFNNKEFDFDVFTFEELKFILSNVVFDTEIIERKFNSLPVDIVIENQIITEKIFLEHFEKININLLKQNKKTDWVADESKRSMKLKMFLRVKQIIL